MSEVTKKYFRGQYCVDLCVFTTLSESLSGLALSPHDLGVLDKLLRLFFLGQLVGLPTLHSLLHSCGVRSNKLQIDYKNLCKQLSIKQLHSLFESVFEQHVFDALAIQCAKHESCWSRELVTLVLDDSVFKQWLNQQSCHKDFEDCYGSFFSGQLGRPVFGCRVVCLAICIDGVIYPLFFDYVKPAKGNPDAVKASVVAQSLVKKWGVFVEKSAKKGVNVPVLHLSCDNGYSDLDLSMTCSKNHLTYISVPKKTHDIRLWYQEGWGKKIKIKDWIDDYFLPAEAKYSTKQKAIQNPDKGEPFICRFKAYYCAQNREVTFLAFRLNGSGKVSIIYCPCTTIHAKTLRRHWFQRTYIEQFFKILKHVCKIQEARIKTKTDFTLKLLRFLFVAWHLQKLTKVLRKKNQIFKKIGLITIQRTLVKDIEIHKLLQEICAAKD